MLESVTRHVVTGEAFVRGTQVPVDFVLRKLDEGYPLEEIAQAVAREAEQDVLDAVQSALMFPELLGNEGDHFFHDAA